MLQGSGWDAKTVVFIEADNGEWMVTPANQMAVNSRSLRFVLPGGLRAGLRKCRIENKNGSLSVTLNRPQPWWLQGDAGASASCGGWLRLFGRCLSVKDSMPRVVLGFNDQFTALDLAESSEWNLTARLPAQTPVGRHEVWVHNGSGIVGDGSPDRASPAWSLAGSIEIAPSKDFWANQQVLITDHGAVPDDGKDDSEALKKGLARLASRSGGVLLIPRGRFHLAGSLRIPPGILLRGAGMDLTHLVWKDVDPAPPALLTNDTGQFGLEDLSIYASNYERGLYVPPPKPTVDGKNKRPANVVVRRVRARFTPLSVAGLTAAQKQVREAKVMASAVAEIHADNIKFINCDFSWYAGIGFSLQGSNILCRGNVAHAVQGGWCPVGGGRGSITEHNDFIGVTTGVVRAANAWFAHNQVRLQFAGFREGFTNDGTYGGVGFLQNVKVEGAKVTFSADQGRSEPAHIPAAIRVIDGKGAGQYRNIVNFKSDSIEMERPFDVEPDETSVFWASNALERQILYDNEFADTGIAVQLYGSGLDCVVAQNRSARSGGFRAWGNHMCWYTQLIGNEIVEGYGTAGPETRPGESSFAIDGPFVKGYKGTTARGFAIRRNVVQNNGTILIRGSIHDAIVENNLIRHSRQGIVGELVSRQDGIVLRGNRFAEVNEPLSPKEAQQTYSSIK